MGGAAPDGDRAFGGDLRAACGPVERHGVLGDRPLLGPVGAAHPGPRSGCGGGLDRGRRVCGSGGICGADPAGPGDVGGGVGRGDVKPRHSSGPFLESGPGRGVGAGSFGGAGPRVLVVFPGRGGDSGHPQPGEAWAVLAQVAAIADRHCGGLVPHESVLVRPSFFGGARRQLVGGAGGGVFRGSPESHGRCPAARGGRRGLSPATGFVDSRRRVAGTVLGQRLALGADRIGQRSLGAVAGLARGGHWVDAPGRGSALAGPAFVVAHVVGGAFGSARGRRGFDGFGCRPGAGGGGPHARTCSGL